MIPDEKLIKEIDRLADGESPPTQTEYREQAEHSVSTVRRRFGSWNDALMEAGYDVNRPSRVSKEELLAEIDRLAGSEYGPYSHVFNEQADYGLTTVRNRFESWRKAVIEAGYQPKKWVPEEKLLEEIDRLSVGNSPPTTAEFRNRADYSRATVRDRFGSWNEALKEAGYKVEAEITDEELLEEIDRLADGDSPPSKKEFRQQAEYSVGTVTWRFESWNKAVTEAGYNPNEAKDISKEELLAEIERLADGDSPPSAPLFDEYADYSSSTVNRKFDSWNQAIIEAGYQPYDHKDMPKLVSEEELLGEIDRLADGDSPPSIPIFNQESAHSASTVERRFESWNDAVIKAGYQPNQTVSEHELLAEINRLADSNSPPTQAEYTQQADYSPTTVRRKFGSWNEAVTKAGYQPNKHSFVSGEELLTEIKRLADGNNPPTIREFNEKSDYYAPTAWKRFGSWNEALIEAGYQPNKVHSVTKQELIEAIQALAENNSPPTQTEFNQESNHGTNTVRSKFGSWNQALTQAGYQPNKRGFVSEEDLIAEIDRLANGNTPPTQREFDKKTEHSASSAKARFGSWNDALIQAGYQPNKPSDVPEEVLLKEIERLADGDSPPSIEEFNKKSKHGATTVEQRFGSWSEAIVTAGYHPHFYVRDEQLLVQLAEDVSSKIASAGSFCGEYDYATYKRRFGWWRACVRAGLIPSRRRPLSRTEADQFFEAAIEQQVADYQLIGLMTMLTGVTPMILTELSKSWITVRSQGDVVITVPDHLTASGEEWTFEVPNGWTDSNGKKHDTELSGLLNWYLNREEAINYHDTATERIIYRIADDAELQDRAQIQRDGVGVVPQVRPGDLRATGGIQMARNGAPAHRIRRHLGLRHTNWDAKVGDFFIWNWVHENEFTHQDFEPPSSGYIHPVTGELVGSQYSSEEIQEK